MMWLRPWAWLGAATILLPILIHLLGRGQSITHRFPSLRFIDPSRLLPAQRNRLQDLPLLAVRIAVLLLAVAALAQPRLRLTPSTSAFGRSGTRAIVIDTSASMARPTPSGTSGRDAAVAAADRLDGDATTTRRFLTATPAATARAAASWLDDQPGPRELVVISDFQLGAFDSSTVTALPASIGVRLLPIGVTAAATSEFVSLQDDGLVTATVAADSAASTVSWRRSASTAEPAGVQWLVGPTEAVAAAAARRAAEGIGLPLKSSSPDTVVLVFPGAPEHASLRARATPLRAAWMIAVVSRLRETPLLDQLAPPFVGNGDSLLPAVWSASGSVPIAVAADGSRLLLFVAAPVASPFAAALAATVTRLTQRSIDAAESEPMVIAPTRLATWERVPAPTTAVADPSPDASSGRWLWGAALAMLLVEAMLRRRTAARVEESDALT